MKKRIRTLVDSLITPNPISKAHRYLGLNRLGRYHDIHINYGR